jgi:hypothetical protein
MASPEEAREGITNQSEDIALESWLGWHTTYPNPSFDTADDVIPYMKCDMSSNFVFSLLDLGP